MISCGEISQRGELDGSINGFKATQTRDTDLPAAAQIE
jgi:hypothetical protein